MGWTWCLIGSEPWCAGWFVERLLPPLVIAIIAYNLAVRQLRKKREIDFAEKQLAEFYAPMLGARAEILSHTRFDVYMNNTSRAEDAKRQRRQAGRAITQESLASDREYEETLKRFFEGLNARLFDERIDAYIKMRELFAHNMAYADMDTREWYEYFYAFVEMWRVIRDNDRKEPPVVPRSVQARLGRMFDEAQLQPFYDHIRDRCDHLQAEISGKRHAKKPVPKPPQISLEGPDDEEE
jgi:hypothetical protein